METLRYVVLVNGLLAIVSVAYYLLLRRETFFGANRLALWLGLAGAVILPLLELPDWRPQPVRTVMQRTAQAIVPKVLPAVPPPDVTITFPNGQIFPAFHRQPKQFIWSWQMGLLVLYIAGVFGLLIRLGIQLLSLRKLIRHSVHELYDDFTLVQSELVTSPFSFFGWVVINPSQHTADELEQILRHERVHVRERHSLDMLGAEVVCIIFWFNPAAYLFRHLLHQTLEFSADRAVLAEGIDAKAYQYNLVKVSLSARQSVITNHFSKSQLKSRISMLNKPNSPEAAWLKYPVLLIAALTVASTFARPQHIKMLSQYVPKSVAETMELMTAVTKREPIKDSSLSVARVDPIADVKPAKPEVDRRDQQKPSVQQVNLPLDSIRQSPQPDTVRVSPSRYITYQGNQMWWIITPRCTVDDFVLIKKELARHNYTLQLIDVKYDRLYRFIDRIDYTLVDIISGGSTSQEGDGNINMPISSTGGYIEWKTVGDKKIYSSSSYVSIRPTAQILPDQLRKVIIEDEAAVANLIDDKKDK